MLSKVGNAPMRFSSRDPHVNRFECRMLGIGCGYVCNTVVERATEEFPPPLPLDLQESFLKWPWLYFSYRLVHLMLKAQISILSDAEGTVYTPTSGNAMPFLAAKLVERRDRSFWPRHTSSHLLGVESINWWFGVAKPLKMP